MFSVIQKIQRKKRNMYGTPKEIQVYETTFRFTGLPQQTTYNYKYSEERFERPILDAYKISIHDSYREDGKIKKKQWPICTVGYYDLLEFSLYDYADRKIEEIAAEIGLSEDEIYEMIHKKLDPLINEIEFEFQQTEEYKTKNNHDKITTIHFANQLEFEEKYGKDTYKYCFDVFGDLRNPEYLEKLKVDKKAREEYARSSYRNSQQGNYNEYGGSSYSFNSISNYNEEERKMLHEIYRLASKKFHPDVSGDNGDKMKFLTQLKENWGI